MVVLVRPAVCLSLAEAAAVQDDTSDIGRREKGAEMLSGSCVLPVHTAEEALRFRMTFITSKTLPCCFSCSRPAPGCVAPGREAADAWIWPLRGLTAVPWAVQMLLLCPIPILFYKILLKKKGIAVQEWNILSQNCTKLLKGNMLPLQFSVLSLNSAYCFHITTLGNQFPHLVKNKPRAVTAQGGDTENSSLNRQFSFICVASTEAFINKTHFLMVSQPSLIFLALSGW